MANAVTLGEVHSVATNAGQKNVIAFMTKTGWSNRLFLLSLDDNKIQKLSTPTDLSSLAVPDTCDKFYVPKFRNEGHPIYMYSKENSWAYVNTGIIVSKNDWPGSKTPSMTFSGDDNLLCILDTEGYIG